MKYFGAEISLFLRVNDSDDGDAPRLFWQLAILKWLCGVGLLGQLILDIFHFWFGTLLVLVDCHWQKLDSKLKIKSVGHFRTNSLIWFFFFFFFFYSLFSPSGDRCILRRQLLLLAEILHYRWWWCPFWWHVIPLTWMLSVLKEI